LAKVIVDYPLNWNARTGGFHLVHRQCEIGKNTNLGGKPLDFTINGK